MSPLSLSEAGTGPSPNRPTVPVAPVRRTNVLPPGVRASAVDGRLTISTGTPSLDSSLAGYMGIPLGHSLLLQESTTTDFGGVVLRYFAAEGLVLGQHVHVVGVGEAWKASLPGLSAKQESSSSKSQAKPTDEKMKIAWRYESLGNQQRNTSGPKQETTIYCHRFDLNKRLEPSAIKGQFSVYQIPLDGGLLSILADLNNKIQASPEGTIHRILIPNLLLPTIYPASMCRPVVINQFLHGLRAILRRYPEQTAAILTMSADLFPPDTGLGKWIENMSDGVAHLVPTPSQIVNTEESKENIQGYFNLTRLPVYNEKGGGHEEGNFGQSLSFKLSSSSGLVIAPLALPPTLEMEPAETDNSHGHSHSHTDKKKLDF